MARYDHQFVAQQRVHAVKALQEAMEKLQQLIHQEAPTAADVEKVKAAVQNAMGHAEKWVERINMPGDEQ